MKRRDFLTASAGISGLVIGRAFGAEAKPCPPAALGVSGGTSISDTCVQVTLPGAPDWFAAQRERAWISVAAPDATIQGTGKRLIDVWANQNLGWGGSFDGVTGAWTGGSVDPVRGELLLVANGGHADYVGNEAYACAIRTQKPGWYRLSDPSPSSAVKAVLPPTVVAGGTGLAESTGNTPSQQGSNPKNFAAMLGDGRMRAVHGWHSAVFHRSRVWYATQSSPTGIGFSTNHAWSWNRNHVNTDGMKMPQGAAESPQRWENNPGPWKWLGPSGGDRWIDFGEATPCALDPVTGKIWMPSSSWLTAWMSLDTTNERIQAATCWAQDHGGTSGTWAAVVVDPSGQDRWRMFVVPSMASRRLMVLNLKHPDPYSLAAWSFVSVSDWSLLEPYGDYRLAGFGAVYHRASTAVLLGNPYTLRSGEVLKLRVPTNSDGSYNNNMPWPISTVMPAASSENPSVGLRPVEGSNNQAHSKFNLIDDMGNGQSALVVVMDIRLPTYVYKLPVQGL